MAKPDDMTEGKCDICGKHGLTYWGKTVIGRWSSWIEACEKCCLQIDFDE